MGLGQLWVGEGRTQEPELRPLCSPTPTAALSQLLRPPGSRSHCLETCVLVNSVYMHTAGAGGSPNSPWD